MGWDGACHVIEAPPHSMLLCSSTRRATRHLRVTVTTGQHPGQQSITLKDGCSHRACKAYEHAHWPLAPAPVPELLFLALVLES